MPPDIMPRGQNATGQNATTSRCMRCSAEQDCKYSGAYLGVGPLRLGPLWWWKKCFVLIFNVKIKFMLHFEVDMLLRCKCWSHTVLWSCITFRDGNGSSFVTRPITHVIHHTVDPWPTWPMTHDPWPLHHFILRMGLGWGVAWWYWTTLSVLRTINRRLNLSHDNRPNWVSSFLMSTKNKVR